MFGRGVRSWEGRTSNLFLDGFADFLFVLGFTALRIGGWNSGSFGIRLPGHCGGTQGKRGSQTDGWYGNPQKKRDQYTHDPSLPLESFGMPPSL